MTPEELVAEIKRVVFGARTELPPPAKSAVETLTSLVGNSNHGNLSRQRDCPLDELALHSWRPWKTLFA